MRRQATQVAHAQILLDAAEKRKARALQALTEARQLHDDALRLYIEAEVAHGHRQQQLNHYRRDAGLPVITGNYVPTPVTYTYLTP